MYGWASGSPIVTMADGPGLGLPQQASGLPPCIALVAHAVPVAASQALGALVVLDVGGLLLVSVTRDAALP